MFTALMPNPKQQFFDNNGIPLIAGKVYTYDAGTSNPKATYTNEIGTIPQANPIILNARGEPANAIRWVGAYRVEVRDVLNNLIYTVDDFQTPIGADEIADITGAGLVGFDIGQVYPLGSVGRFLVDLGLSTGATFMRYISSVVGAVARTVQAKLRDEVTTADFGCVGNGVADDTVALGKVKTALNSGVVVRGLPGVHLTSLPLVFTSAPNFICDPGFRIKLTAAADSVIKIDGSGGGPGWLYGSQLKNLILDGNGFAQHGLDLKNVINGTFDDVRVTNTVVSGFKLGWAQLCNFRNIIVSGNIEAFTTTPQNGILVDGTVSSSANTFENISMEKVSGSGVKALSLINSQFIGGTSEGNAVGLEFGETVDVGRTAVGNIVLGMDMEVNSVSDVILRVTANTNSFYALQAGYLSPAVQILGSSNNYFSGGSVGGITMNAASHDNRIDSVKMFGVGATITDAGTFNNWRGIYNVSTATRIADSGTRGKVNYAPGAGATVSIDLAVCNFASVRATGTPINIALVPVATDALEVDVTIYNVSGAPIVVNWSAAFKITGWVNPANGFNRTARFRIDNASGGFVFVEFITAVDNAN
jgi:hypothetical protein